MKWEAPRTNKTVPELRLGSPNLSEAGRGTSREGHSYLCKRSIAFYTLEKLLDWGLERVRSLVALALWCWWELQWDWDLGRVRSLVALAL